MPLQSILVISLCSALVIVIAMELGSWLRTIFTSHVTEEVGGLLLILIGLWTLVQQLNVMKPEVLQAPVLADLNNSGRINSGEAFILGLALSLDSFGSGIGLALASDGSLSAVQVALVIASASGLFLSVGLGLGRRIGERSARMQAILNVLPGIMLIAIGCTKYVS